MQLRMVLKNLDSWDNRDTVNQLFEDGVLAEGSGYIHGTHTYTRIYLHTHTHTHTHTHQPPSHY
jgi:hypothetical protein